VNIPLFNEMFTEIKEKTNGLVSIELKLSSQLPISASTYTQAVGDGVVQVVDDGFAVGNVPILGVLKLPMLIQSIDEAEKVAKIAFPHISKAYAGKGAVALGSYFLPSQVFFAKSEFNGLSDLVGKKVETDSPQQERFVKAFGGVGLAVSPADVPTAIQRGALDVVITASAGGGKIWADMLTHNYRLSVSEFPVIVAVNMEAFEALPKEAQDEVRGVVEKHMPRFTKAYVEDEIKVTEDLKRNGMKITTPSSADLTAAAEKMAPYWDQWAKATGPEAEALLKDVRAALGR
jgi:TRAP-type C4-dicarboxylate transport system substrate-binding protein